MFKKTFTNPFLQAEAKRLPLGDHEIQRTQLECPSHVLSGNSVVKSHRRTVLSPEPLAKELK